MMFEGDVESYKLSKEHIRFPGQELPFMKGGTSSELSLRYNVQQLDGTLDEEEEDDETLRTKEQISFW
jgi:hypothetical protein